MELVIVDLVTSFVPSSIYVETIPTIESYHWHKPGAYIRRSWHCLATYPKFVKINGRGNFTQTQSPMILHNNQC